MVSWLLVIVANAPTGLIGDDVCKGDLFLMQLYNLNQAVDQPLLPRGPLNKGRWQIVVRMQLPSALQFYQTTPMSALSQPSVCLQRLCSSGMSSRVFGPETEMAAVHLSLPKPVVDTSSMCWM